MQPEQHPPNYDFILNPAEAPKRAPLGSSSMATRLLIVLGGLFVLVIIASVVIKLLGGSSGSFNKAAMLSVAQDQTQIIHLTDSGLQNSVSQTSKNFTITAQLGMQSEQTTLLAYLSAHGYKIKDKSLTAKQSAATDSQLASAQSSSTFDETYKGVMQQALQTYERDLSTAYKDASPSAKTTLAANYKAAQLLLTQLTSG